LQLGKKERAVRWIIGLVIGAIGIYYRNWWALIGIIPTLTAVVGYCPLSAIPKLNTWKNEMHENAEITVHQLW
jgi:hypothetical protein